MSTITFENGAKVNFDGDPSPQDVDFVAKQLGIANNQASNQLNQTQFGNQPTSPLDALNAPQPPQQGPSALDVLNNPQLLQQMEQKSGGFLDSLMRGVKSTLGFNTTENAQEQTGSDVLGIASTGQLPGRAAYAYQQEKTAKNIDESRGNLAESTTNLIRAMRDIQDPQRKAVLQGIVDENVQRLQQMNEQARNIQSQELTQGQIAGSAGKAALTFATAGVSGLGGGELVSGPLAKTGLLDNLPLAGPVMTALRTSAKALEGAGIGLGYNTAQNLVEGNKPEEGAGTASLVGSAFGPFGELASATSNWIGNTLEKRGTTLVVKAIKPIEIDRINGFDASNIAKYNLNGITLRDIFDKTMASLGELGKQMKRLMANNPEAKVNVLDALQATKDEFIAPAGKLAEAELPKAGTPEYREAVGKLREGGEKIVPSKMQSFGFSDRINNSLSHLEQELQNVSLGEGKDLAAAPMDWANELKSVAGQLGAWLYKAPDPNANALEAVYTSFYRNLRNTINNAAPKEFQQINKAFSDIIPIRDALLRRIPVAERQSPIGLKSALYFLASLKDPVALSLYFGDKALSLPGAGGLISNMGTRIKATSIPRVGPIGKILPAK